ncbi:MAG: hypothetical protein ACRDY2_08870 [Acidimicrobiales bacterium]
MNFLEEEVWPQVPPSRLGSDCQGLLLGLLEEFEIAEVPFGERHGLFVGNDFTVTDLRAA